MNLVKMYPDPKMVIFRTCYPFKDLLHCLSVELKDSAMEM